MKKLSEALYTPQLRLYLLIAIACTLYLPILVNSALIVLYVLHWIITVPTAEKKEYFNKNKLLFFLFLSFYFVNAISVLYSDNKKEAITDLEVKLSLVIFPLVTFLNRPISKADLQKVLYYFSIVSVAVATLAVIISLVKTQTIATNQDLAILVKMHASYFSLYLAFAFFILLHKSLTEGFDKLHSLLMAITVVYIALLASRAVEIGFIGALFIWFVFVRFNLRIIAFTGIALVAVIAVSRSFKPVRERFYEAINIKDSMELDADPNEYKTLKRDWGGRALRVAIWQCSMDVLAENWLLGAGCGDFQDKLQESYKNHAFEFAWRYNRFNAHNLFIQAVGACGTAGVLALLTLLAYLLWNAIKKKEILLFAFVFLFLSISLVESSLNVQKGVVYFCYFSTLLASVLIQLPSSSTPVSRQESR